MLYKFSMGWEERKEADFGLLFCFCDKYIIMENIEELKKMSGILSESKYGYKFDQFYSPFKNEDKKVKDKNGRELCECKDSTTAKELAAVLTDIKQLRELCDKIMSLPNR